MRSARRRSAASQETPAGVPGWTSTYGNLMTVIVAFFVVLYGLTASGVFLGGEAASAVTPGDDKATKPVASLLSVRLKLARALDQQGAGESARMESTAGTLVVHLDAGALFDSGRAEIRPAAIPVLDAIGAALGEVGNQVHIEGHTDNIPMIPNPQFPDNWTLSEARAAGVLRYLHDLHHIESARLSLAGYADTRPIDTNGTPTGRARNRRVDIVVLGH